MILACAAVLGQAAGKGCAGAERASRAIYEATLETTAGDVKTLDLGGHATTTEFTDAVVMKVRTKVEIWSRSAPSVDPRLLLARRSSGRWTNSTAVPASTIEHRLIASCSALPRTLTSPRRRRRSPMLAAAGIVVTLISTPISAPDLPCSG